MPLDDTQARWINLFTAGSVKLPDDLAQSDEQDPVKNLEKLLKLARLKESVPEQALKDVLMGQAIAAIDKVKEKLRASQDFAVERLDEKGKTVTERTIDPKGQQKNSFESSDTKGVQKVEGLDIHKGEAGQFLVEVQRAYELLEAEKDKLLAATIERSHIDVKAQTIIQKTEPLFTDKEIMDGLYTPLVRELVIAETFVENRFSATQKMIEGSNDYYIKECKEKGKEINTGALALGKGAVALASTITTTVLGSLAPVNTDPTAMQVTPLSGSGALSKFDSTRATEITNGIAACLTGTLDFVDNTIETYRGGEFPTGNFKAAICMLGVGIGKIVAGSEIPGAEDLGLSISTGIDGGCTAVAFGKTIFDWAKDPKKPFPWDEMCTAIGTSLADALNVASDNQSDTGIADKESDAASWLSNAFGTLGKAAKARVLPAIMNGNWDVLFDFITDSATDLGKTLPAVLYFNDAYNSISGADDSTPPDQVLSLNEKEYEKQNKLNTSTETMNSGIEKMGSGVQALGKLPPIERLLERLPETKTKKLSDEQQKKFDALQKSITDAKEKEEASDIGKIEERLKKEMEDYRESLNCLGSQTPSDSDYKSIAKLIAQIERDRAIWDGVFALFGGGIGAASGVGAALSVAAEVAAPLKAAGQLVKFCTNLKAAADRMQAVSDWRESQKDSVSGVSPYATSIQNFLDNQTSQRNHYCIQAAANAIQALLACGEMSPLAPAFKVAGASVGATAAVEDLVYKFKKQAALKAAWKITKEALEPKNANNRKLHLQVRELNPTLAKYTIAYGALIAKDPIAITACNRVGLDRETLARAKDKVGDVRKYLDTLYKDDGTVTGMIEVKGGTGKVKMPTVELTVRAWTLSCALLKKNAGLVTESPPVIAGSLVVVENLVNMEVEYSGIVDLNNPKAVYTETQEKYTKKMTKDYEDLCAALTRLSGALRGFKPVQANGEPCEEAVSYAKQYADLAEAKLTSWRLEWGSEQEPSQQEEQEEQEEE